MELIKTKLNTNEPYIEEMFTYGIGDTQEKFIKVMCNYIDQLATMINIDEITITRDFLQYYNLGKEFGFKYDFENFVDNIPKWYQIEEEK